jgi:hypothetical protein
MPTPIPRSAAAGLLFRLARRLVLIPAAVHRWLPPIRLDPTDPGDPDERHLWIAGKRIVIRPAGTGTGPHRPPPSAAGPCPAPAPPMVRAHNRRGAPSRG